MRPDAQLFDIGRIVRSGKPVLLRLFIGVFQNIPAEALRRLHEIQGGAVQRVLRCADGIPWSDTRNRRSVRGDCVGNAADQLFRYIRPCTVVDQDIADTTAECSQSGHHGIRSFRAAFNDMDDWFVRFHSGQYTGQR